MNSNSLEAERIDASVYRAKMLHIGAEILDNGSYSNLQLTIDDAEGLLELPFWWQLDVEKRERLILILGTVAMIKDIDSWIDGSAIRYLHKRTGLANVFDLEPAKFSCESTGWQPVSFDAMDRVLSCIGKSMLLSTAPNKKCENYLRINLGIDNVSNIALEEPEIQSYIDTYLSNDGIGSNLS